MTYWLDRRGSLGSGRPVTHALVVGVSEYDWLPTYEEGPSPDALTFGLVQITSAATGAFRFARWLRDCYRNPAAPLATVRLLLSGSALERRADPELDQACAAVQTADRENVRTALLDWQSDNRGNGDGTALFFASGHGVMLSYTDSLVLLRDFAKDQRVLDYSLDVGSVHRGMNGPDLPQTQFYFVDSCKIRPEAFSAYRNAGTGVGLTERLDVADRRAAPIFFSASPNTPAYGERGGPTIFARALVEGLAGAAVDNQVDDDGFFVITNGSLQRSLEERVNALARQYGETQHVVGGGQSRTCVLHRFEHPPELPFVVGLAPDHAHRIARADVWDCDRIRRIISGQSFGENPTVWRLPAGVHSLDVHIEATEPTLRAQTGLTLLVQAKQAPRPRWVRLDADARP